MIEQITDRIISDNSHLAYCHDKFTLGQISMRIKKLVISKQLNEEIGKILLEKINKKVQTVDIQEKIREIHRNRY